MRPFELSPADPLFLRDARPMAGSDVGRGANWPRPDQLWNALINAFHAAWPERRDWEGAPPRKTGRAKPERARSSDRFGALKSVGPFPFIKANGADAPWFPCPADLGMKWVSLGDTDLPSPLRYAFLPKTKEKTAHPQWIDADRYRKYLAGETFTLPDAELCDCERAIGIAMDPETGAAEDAKLYQAEYLRLRPGVSMIFFADCRLQPKDGALVDVFDRQDRPRRLVFGGQRGVADISPVEKGFAFPFAGGATPFSGNGKVFLRWTLLTPAVFESGWRPGWVRENGKAQLPRGKVGRRDFPGKEARRKAKAALGFVEARLVAARVPKPLAFSGWRVDENSPKPTLLAVPGGSCYVFECPDAEEAGALAKALSWPNPRSDRFGEKGFGIGVCSQVFPHDD